MYGGKTVHRTQFAPVRNTPVSLWRMATPLCPCYPSPISLSTAVVVITVFVTIYKLHHRHQCHQLKSHVSKRGRQGRQYLSTSIVPLVFEYFVNVSTVLCLFTHQLYKQQHKINVLLFFTTSKHI